MVHHLSQFRSGNEEREKLSSPALLPKRRREKPSTPQMKEAGHARL
jgi:hypothetical protein